jgi:hypothetical protein
MKRLGYVFAEANRARRVSRKVLGLGRESPIGANEQKILVDQRVQFGNVRPKLR